MSIGQAKFDYWKKLAGEKVAFTGSFGFTFPMKRRVFSSNKAVPSRAETRFGQKIGGKG